MPPTDSAKPYLTFVGGYSPADQPGIRVFSYDSENGALTLKGQFAGITNPSFLVAHPNGKWLYAVGETTQADNRRAGTVWALRFDRATWAINALNYQSSRGDAPCHLAIDATGRWLVVSNYVSGSAGILPVLGDGSVGAMSSVVQHEGRGPNEARQEGPHAHSAAFSPDGRHVLVADLGIDQLVVYRFDDSTGRLTWRGEGATHPGAGPRHMAFNAAGTRLYVANELDSTVTVFDYDTDTGGLRERQTLSTVPLGAPENYVADIHLSGSGRYLYVSNRGHDSLAVFEVGDDGLLTRLGMPSCGGKWPRNFALAPDGRFALVANEHSDQVSVLPLSKDGAEIGAPVSQAAAPNPSTIQFVADDGDA